MVGIWKICHSLERCPLKESFKVVSHENVSSNETWIQIALTRNRSVANQKGTANPNQLTRSGLDKMPPNGLPTIHAIEPMAPSMDKFLVLSTDVLVSAMAACAKGALPANAPDKKRERYRSGRFVMSMLTAARALKIVQPTSAATNVFFLPKLSERDPNMGDVRSWARGKVAKRRPSWVVLSLREAFSKKIARSPMSIGAKITITMLMFNRSLM